MKDFRHKRHPSYVYTYPKLYSIITEYIKYLTTGIQSLKVLYTRP